MLHRRATLGGLFCLACAGFGPAATRPAQAADPVAKTTLTPNQALARLLEGNARFVADNPMQPALGSGRRHELAVGQAPFATVIGCADSRTPPEAMFGAGLGELFTTRVAGNTIPAASLGSVAYSVDVLGSPLVLVLGHERCGAVAAAVEVVTKGARLPDVLQPMVEPILGAVTAARGRDGDLLDNAVRENALIGARRLRRHPAFAAKVRAGTLMIAAARYDLDDGKVEVLEG